MKSYRIDVENSSTGPVGFLAYVRGKSRAEALIRFMKTVSREGYSVMKEPEVEVIVYLNPSQVRLSEVERE